MGFQQGLSGLNATAKNLEVIGNNIANANTFGAKASRGEFSDVYAASLSGAGTNSVGIGTRLASVSQQFTQGNVTTTENPMDLAINGSGFFQVTDGASTLYTRNGQFKVDREGYIVNSEGLQLQGFMADAQGNIPQGGRPVALQLSSTARMPPQATDEMAIDMNLDSRAAVKTGDVMASPNNFNNATSVTVYDAQGRDAALTYYFQKSGTDQWSVFFSIDGTQVMDGGSPAQIQLTFNPDGSGLASAPTGSIPLTIPGAADGSRLDITTSIDFSKATQYGSSFGVSDLTQTGFTSGQLVNIAVESTGIIMARYSNGKQQPAGQVQLATFRNPQGLQAIGGNLWTQTFASGQPIPNMPGEGNMGSLQSGALEESNVDLTGELVGMIMAQRIYQANAQTIKTEDQVMQTLVNLR
ncbi:flagellar hook protein FlgE [Aquabacterium sp. J223]|uniref:flagellar hook protein FlgE n=1 Tax=Aquabacterium sp. J223 TaxID=2898431 RepID=UPI0021ADB036|nr:flagellar hook protein FlgE [Aquabacterium sp. J223]UUX97552.1 flagellar hook protein FlgE [Aquabacterium sp. J223]